MTFDDNFAGKGEIKDDRNEQCNLLPFIRPGTKCTPEFQGYVLVLFNQLVTG